MASITQFSSTIDKIRNILRLHTPSIVNEQSSNHICLYILARCLTIKKCTELKIPLDFAWENIVKQFRNVEGGKQRGYDLFYSPTEECFIKHVDTLFGTSSEDYPFKVRELEKHKQIVELIDKIDMDSIDLGVDAFGFVYEDELTHSKGARKNGEHFTDRKICDYMTKLVNPRVNADGVPESVCDPSMGTGGFLFTYQKFFKDAKIDVNWNIHKHRIYGQDVINSSVCKAKMNLYVNTNMVCENLVLRNSLTNDLQNTSFDIILANMPFGLKGLKHADCCERVKGLKIRGTKSEPLFLQLMMVSLAPGGRCAVVVPDGMLVNTSSLHDETRKYLLDHFELKRVIKMKGQFFMNTSIQPSILFFENTGKPTTAVEFWEVLRNEKGEITESMVVSVPRAKMDASCSFDMRRYLESDKPVANPAGFPMVKLGAILVGVKGTTLTLEKATPGSFPLYSASVDIRSHTEPGFDEQESIIQACVGSNLVNCIHYVNRPFAATGNLWVLRKKEPCDIALKFVYYWLLLTKTVLKKVNVSVLPKINKKDFDEILMPLPPRPIQDEIVATLDRIYSPGTTELADTIKMTDRAMDLVLASPGGATLEPIVEAQRLIRKSAQMVADVKAQMVADVKAQMVAIVKASCASSEEKPISEIVKLKYGFPFKSSDYTTEGLVVVKHNNITDGYVSKSKKQDYIPSSSQTDDYKMVVGDIVISMDFDCGKVGKIVEAGWVLNQRVCLARTSSENLRQEYLYWALRFGGFYERMQTLHTGTTIKHISGKDIDKATIKLPSLALQDATLVRLSLLQSQLTALESLQKQTEDNARFILDSYLPSAPIENTIITP